MFDLAEAVAGTAGQGLSDQELEDEICAHGARLAAGECHLVMLVAEMDRRGTWYGPGLKSMAHWLNWRLGTSLHAAREQVRVGRALRSLPVLRAAFASGELSYSKARALSRVATPATEEAFVYMARYTTASQLELIVRSYRKADPDEGKEAMERYRYRRWFRSRTDEDGMVLISARLAPEDAAVVLAAVEAAREAAWRAGRPGGEGAETAAGTRGEDEGTPAHPAGIKSTGSAFEHEGADQGSGPEASGDVPAGTPAGAGAAGATSLGGPAGELRPREPQPGEPQPGTGTGPGHVPAGTPEEGRPAEPASVFDFTGWDRRPVGWDDDLGESPGWGDEEAGATPSASTLAAGEAYEERELAMADALVMACEQYLARGPDREGRAGPPVTVVVHVDEEVLKDPSAEGCARAEGVGAITSHTAQRLACSSAMERIVFRANGSVEPGGRTGPVTEKLRRAVLARDGGCRYPGCTERSYVDVHHVVFRSQGGPTVASNLCSLCRWHHRLVHEGGYRLEMSPAGEVTVRGPDGWEVPASPAPARPADLDLASGQEQGGLHVGPGTLDYSGESFDLGLTIDVLLQAAGKLG
ncbi:MAG: DUF222 domain-containing protein [Actinomycetota bacterium]|jgi:hypothetical protein|nr:DUF222 domain-containing protein [Actinomycetota bacterium]